MSIQTVKRKYRISDMHCSSCALTIDMDLEELDGVNSAKTSYAKAELEIEFDPEKVSENQILETIQKSGYKAQSLMVN